MPEPSGDSAIDQRPTDGLDSSERDLDFACAVALDSFSGPLDLLLFLVRRAEVDVVDIPIAQIADQFVATVASWQDLDLELAGEFILMAASLLEIKARLIAPPPEEPAEGETDGEEESSVDLRAELVSKLLAYRRFKEAALDLLDREHDHAQRLVRQLHEEIPEDPEEAEGIDLENADPYLLHSTWDLVMKRITGLGPRTVVGDPVPLEAVFADLIDTMRARSTERLSRLFAAQPTKVGRVTTFMAVLECARQRFLEVQQHGQYEDAELRFRAEDEREVRVIEFTPEPPPPRRQKRPPLVTVQQREAGEDDGPVVDEAPTETDEARFLRELEETCAVESVLERTADVEQGFARYWAEKRGLPWPPPPPPAPVAPEPVAAAPAAPPIERAPRPKRQPKPPGEKPAAEQPAAPVVAEAAATAEKPEPLLLLPAPVPTLLLPAPVLAVVEMPAAPIVAEAAPAPVAAEAPPAPAEQPVAIAPAIPQVPAEPTPVTTAVLPDPAAIAPTAPAEPVAVEPPPAPVVAAAPIEPEVVEPAMPEVAELPAAPAASERLVVIIHDLDPTPVTLQVPRAPDVVPVEAQERFEPTPVTISIPRVLPEEPPVEPELKSEPAEEPEIPAAAMVVVAAPPTEAPPASPAPLAAPPAPEPEPVVTPAKARTRQTTLDRPFRERLGPRRQHTLALSATLLVLAAGCWFAYHASTSRHGEATPPETADQVPPRIENAGPATTGPGPAPLATASVAAFGERLLDARACADLASWLGVALGDAEKPAQLDPTAGIAFGPLPEEPAPAPEPAAVAPAPEPETIRPLMLPPPPAPPAPGMAYWLDRLISADDLETFVTRLNEGVPVLPPAPAALPAPAAEEPPQRAFLYQREPMMSQSAWLVIWAWDEPPQAP